MLVTTHDPANFQHQVIASLEHLIEKIKSGTSVVTKVMAECDPMEITFTTINDPVKFYPVMRTITIEEIQHHASHQ